LRRRVCQLLETPRPSYGTLGRPRVGARSVAVVRLIELGEVGVASLAWTPSLSLLRRHHRTTAGGVRFACQRQGINTHPWHGNDNSNRRGRNGIRGEEMEIDEAEQMANDEYEMVIQAAEPTEQAEEEPEKETSTPETARSAAPARESWPSPRSGSGREYSLRRTRNRFKSQVWARRWRASQVSRSMAQAPNLRVVVSGGWPRAGVCMYGSVSGPPRRLVWLMPRHPPR